MVDKVMLTLLYVLVFDVEMKFMILRVFVESIEQVHVGAKLEVQVIGSSVVSILKSEEGKSMVR